MTLHGRKLNFRRAIKLVTELMALPGKSGEEGGVADYITEKLHAAGVSPAMICRDAANRRTPIRGDTGNLVLALPGNMQGTRRLLMAHMDTVPICVGSSPVRRSDFIVSSNSQRALGADDRAGCAVVLNSALEIVERGLPHPPLTFCWTIQEEIGLHGARHLNHAILRKPKRAFNWDGGSWEKLTVGATGGYRMAIKIHGIASHAGGAPERGVSAIAIASLAITELVRGGWHGQICKGSKRGTSNVGSFHGGEITNVVSDYVELKAEARSHDPRFRNRIRKEIEKAFVGAARQIKNDSGQSGRVDVDGRLDYEAFRLQKDDPSVLAAEQAVVETGGQPVRAVANGGLDANWMVARGIPTVSLGCGQVNQHMTGEALDVENFKNACRIGLFLATQPKL